MLRLRNLVLLVLMAVMCMGGSFTCRSGDPDPDEDDPPAQTRVRVSF